MTGKPRRISIVLPLTDFARSIEIRLLVLWFTLATAIWSFLKIASELREGELTAFDRGILLALRQPGQPHVAVGPVWVTEAIRDITALGSVTVVLLVTIVAAIALITHGKRREAALFFSTVAIAQFSNDLLKLFYNQTRPEFAIYGTLPLTHSFPSGHTTVATATWFLLAIIVSSLETTRTARVLAFTLAAFLSLAIGASRVYLGVHWPSDVLAGWCAGAAWALVASLIFRTVTRPAPHGA